MDSLLTSAVAAVITDDAGRVLLCQQSQGHRLWGLPGGRIRQAESPMHAAVRDIREETGIETEIVDLVGIYQLTGDACGEHLPDVLMHVFRGPSRAARPASTPPAASAGSSWHDPAALPEPHDAPPRGPPSPTRSPAGPASSARGPARRRAGDPGRDRRRSTARRRLKPAVPSTPRPQQARPEQAPGLSTARPEVIRRCQPRPRRTPAARSALSARSAASPAAWSGASSRQRTSALPTITPSAYAPTSAACAPSRTPSPTPTGSSGSTARTRATSVGRRAGGLLAGAGDAHDAGRVDEAAAVRHGHRQPGVGRRRRRPGRPGRARARRRRRATRRPRRGSGRA